MAWMPPGQELISHSSLLPLTTSYRSSRLSEPSRRRVLTSRSVWPRPASKAGVPPPSTAAPTMKRSSSTMLVTPLGWVYNHTEGSRTDTRIGTELAGYVIQSLLARGGMGEVYLATQAFPERKVALKVLSPELASDPAFRERFVRESNAAASTEHPNIVPVYGAGEADGLLYLAMRYVEGTDLRALIEQEGPLPADRAVSILSQVTEALDAAHDHGLVHRDVKPGNVLLARGSGDRDHAYLTDFGLIRRSEVQTGLTKTGQFMGTIDYCAPEQIKGEEVDRRTDVYSLGCVLYECLVGEPPFKRDREVATIYAHLQEEPPKVSDGRPELPAAFDDVVAKAMAKRPEDRYQTAGELARDARSATAAEPAMRPRAGRSRKRRLTVVGTLAAGLLAILAVGGLVLTRNRAETTPKTSEAAAPPNSVLEIDPTNGRLIRAIPGVDFIFGGTNADVAVGEGGVWALGNGPSLLCIHLQTASETGTVDVGGGTNLVVAFRTVWVATHGSYGPSASNGRLTRVNPATCKLLRSVRLPGDPTAVAAGEGAIWVTTSDGLVRVDPGTNRTQLIAIEGGRDDVAVGEGAIWVLDLLRGNVTRIDPRTGRPEADIQLSGNLNQVAAGEGKVWVLDAGAGIVTPIDPATNSALPPIRVGTDPLDLSVGSGAAWVTDRDGTLWRIDATQGDVSSIPGRRAP